MLRPKISNVGHKNLTYKVRSVHLRRSVFAFLRTKCIVALQRCTVELVAHVRRANHDIPVKTTHAPTKGFVAKKWYFHPIIAEHLPASRNQSTRQVCGAPESGFFHGGVSVRGRPTRGRAHLLAVSLQQTRHCHNRPSIIGK